MDFICPTPRRVCHTFSVDEMLSTLENTDKWKKSFVCGITVLWACTDHADHAGVVACGPRRGERRLLPPPRGRGSRRGTARQPASYPPAGRIKNRPRFYWQDFPATFGLSVCLSTSFLNNRWPKPGAQRRERGSAEVCGTSGAGAGLQVGLDELLVPSRWSSTVKVIILRACQWFCMFCRINTVWQLIIYQILLLWF